MDEMAMLLASRDEWRDRYGKDVAQLRAELAEATTTRDRLSARVAELERLLGEACDEFESAAASFADQGWPALSSEMRTRASRWRREGGIK